MTTRQKLLNHGFQEVKKTQDYRLLELKINEDGDRFPTVLHWYSDEPKKIYINMYKMSGSVTISETEVMENHNGLHDGVLASWKKFKETFTEIKSVK